MMVITKVKQIKSQGSLKRVIGYIADDKKTIKSFESGESEFQVLFTDKGKEVQLLSGHLLINEKRAYGEMMMTNREANRFFGRDNLDDWKQERTEVYAHHIIQSFSPDDNLTPEQVHEIGRRTVMELTGGRHEFVIATHMDKDHLHNHIIFNATNSHTLKKFRWQKGTKRSLEMISDRHAEQFGAMIIQKPETIFDHKRYLVYQRENVHKVEIKSRLEFLLKHSTSLDDFLTKAKELDLAVDTSGKYIKYRLLDRDQDRNTRDRSLSKKGRYSLEAIKKRVAQNEVTYSVGEMKSEYQKLQREKEEDFELRLSVDKSQVIAEVPTGIYVEMEYGLRNRGVVKIPYRFVDKTDDGNFELFVKPSDFFYFANPDKAEKNRFVKGDILVKQLASKNHHYVLKKNPHISKLDELVREFDFLNSHGVTNSVQLDDLQKRFDKQLDETEKTLALLGDKIARLTKVRRALEEYWEEPPMVTDEGEVIENSLARKILDECGVSTLYSLDQLNKELVEITVEKTNLEEKVDKIVFDYKKAETIKENHKGTKIKPEENSFELER